MSYSDEMVLEQMKRNTRAFVTAGASFAYRVSLEGTFGIYLMYLAD